MEKKQIILVSVGTILLKYDKKIQKIFQCREFEYSKHSNKTLENFGKWNFLLVPLYFRKKYGLFGEEISEELVWLKEQNLSNFDVIFVHKKSRYKKLLETPFKFRNMSDFNGEAGFKKLVETSSRKSEEKVSEVSISVDDADREPVEDHMRYDPSNMLTAIKELEENLNYNVNQVKILQEELGAEKKANEAMMKEREELQRKLKKLDRIKDETTKNDNIVETKKGLVERIVAHTKKFAKIKADQEKEEEEKSLFTMPHITNNHHIYNVIWTDFDGIKNKKAFTFSTAVQRKAALIKAQTYKARIISENKIEKI